MRRPAFQLLGAMLLAMALGATGCGYSLVNSGAVPEEVRTVRVRVIAPERSDPLLADSLAREIRRVLRWGGRLRPVESGASDAELVLRIITDRTRAVAFDEFDEVLDYQTTIAVDAQLLRGGASLWSAERVAATRGQAAVEGAVVTSSSAFQGNDVVSREALERFDTVQLGEERKAAAREAVMRDLAETVYSRMIEGL